jgi:pilus assembly protein Flp/PilA
MGEAKGSFHLSHAAGGPAVDPHAARSALALFYADQHGATAIEYALIASMISIVILTAIVSMSGTLTTMFQEVAAGF